MYIKVLLFIKSVNKNTVATALVHQSLYHIIKSTCTKELTQSHVLESLKSCAALIRHTIPPSSSVGGRQ